MDWQDGGADPARAYGKAKAGLDRALAKDSNDLLALQVMAELNVCDCQRAWAQDTREMERIGTQAIDRYLALRPDTPRMLNLRSMIYFKHGRFEDALVLADRVLRSDSKSLSALGMRTTALLKLRRVAEALAASKDLLAIEDSAYTNTLAATVHFAAGKDDAAVLLARSALGQMNRHQLSDPDLGSVALTLIAAEAKAGRVSGAQAALRQFNVDVPGVRTISDVRQWLPADALELDEPSLFDGLRLAGMSE